METNILLKELYASYWKSLVSKAGSLKARAAYPLLIQTRKQYDNADVKVMIIGQETDKWGGGCFNESLRTVESLMGAYDSYFYEGRKNDLKRAFWNKKNFSFFEIKLTKYFSAKGQSVAFLWNNISKIGKHGRGNPGREILTLERDFFKVIKKEVAILKPNLIIFTTGSRDSHIKYHFGKETVIAPILCLEHEPPHKKTKSLIAEVKLEYFPEICAIRVQHPNRRALSNELILEIIIKCLEKRIDKHE